MLRRVAGDHEHHTALLEIRVLQPPHIAEADDAAMTQMENQMSVSEEKARRTLERLTPLLTSGASQAYGRRLGGSGTVRDTQSGDRHSVKAQQQRPFAGPRVWDGGEPSRRPVRNNCGRWTKHCHGTNLAQPDESPNQITPSPNHPMQLRNHPFTHSRNSQAPPEPPTRPRGQVEDGRTPWRGRHCVP